MTDNNTTIMVVMRQRWMVSTFADYDNGKGECIEDEDFVNQAEALLFAAQQADKHGVDIIFD